MRPDVLLKGKCGRSLYLQSQEWCSEIYDKDKVIAQAMRVWTHRSTATSSAGSGTACKGLRSSAGTPLFKILEAPRLQPQEVGCACCWLLYYLYALMKL